MGEVGYASRTSRAPTSRSGGSFEEGANGFALEGGGVEERGGQGRAVEHPGPVDGGLPVGAAEHGGKQRRGRAPAGSRFDPVGSNTHTCPARRRGGLVALRASGLVDVVTAGLETEAAPGRCMCPRLRPRR